MRRYIITCLVALLAGIFSLAVGSDPTYAASSDPTIRVIAGADRYETAVLLSQVGFPTGAPAVVIARGDDHADALCGAPLAHAYGGPLLLTPRTGLTRALIAELQRLNPSRVFLLGLGPEVRTQLEQLVGARRVTALVGEDRYETAALVAEQIRAMTGSPSNVVIAPGNSFPDALAVAPLAAVNNWPILYTPQWDGLPEVTHDEIHRLGVSSALVVGTFTQLDLPRVVRLVGSDRYDTCALITRYALTHGLNSGHIGFATGENFPDGLAAGPYLALDAGILLLARGTTTTAPVARFLAEVSENVHLIEAIGLPRIPTAPAAPPPAGSAPGFDLRAAVAACPPGGTVNMPAGTITVAGDVTLKSNIKLKGQGVGVTVLKASGDFPLIITGTGVTLEGFTLQGNGQKAAGAQYGISVNYGDSASNITMRNLQVSDFSEAGFFGAGMSVINDLVIEDCVFSRCGDFGITKVGASVSSRWTIRNTVCYDFAGVRNPPHGIYLHNVKDLLIDGCELYGPLGHHPSGYSGVELDDCQGTVRNSYAHDCMTTADDGYGFIVVGSCQIVFDTCRGERNAADFFECRLTGTATYQNCTGSKKVY